MLSSTAIRKVQRDFYRFHEAAEVLAVSDVTLWRWIRAGKVQAHRIGREVLIEKAEVEKLRRG